MKCASAFLLLLPLLGAAQDGEPRQRNTALVRVYPRLDQLVDKADGLAREGKWAAALEIYAEAERHPNHVVPAEGPLQGATRFLGAQEFFTRRLATWPEEGRAAYRASVDPVAAEAFQRAREARDPAALAAVAARWPWSSWADDALALLGSLHLEAGRPGPAAEALERALEIPGGDAPRALLIARLGAAWSALGRRERLVPLILRAEKEFAGAKILHGGRELGLDQVLRELHRDAAPPPPPAAESTSWELAQGAPSGNRLAGAVEPGPRAWSANLPGTPFDPEDDPWNQGRGIVPTAPYLPIVPAVSEGLVFAHSDYAAWAWNLYASSADPLWTHRLEPPPGDLKFEDRILHSTSVLEGRVFVNLVTALGRSEVQMNHIPVKFPFPKRALVALDAYTGRVLWRIGGLAGAERFEDGLSFSAAPTPSGGLLYVGAVAQKHPTDPFEHHVLCLEPSTGRILWSTFVASGGTEINLFGNSTRESVSGPVAVDGDSVFACTHHGVVAALDRATGRVAWLYKYPQLPVNPTRRIDIRRNPLEWNLGAPVVAGGAVHVAPADSRLLLALDARTGARRWDRPRGDHRFLLGADGATLLLAGEGLEWIDVAGQGRLRGRFDPSNGRGAGRPAAAVDGVWFPTTQGLYKTSWPDASGAVKSTFLPWNDMRVEGANVVVAEGAVVAASGESLEARFHRKELEKSIEDELAASPSDPRVLHRASLRLLQAGQEARASELLERVIRLTSGSARPDDERLGRAARKRLVAVSMESGRTALAAGNAAAATKHFERARAAAPDPATAVEAAAGLGEAALARRDFAAAIGAFQALLRDHGGDPAIFDLARGRLGAILEAGGRDAYAPSERDAAARLEAVRRAPSAAALLEIFRLWPNSSAAETAVLEAASVASAAGRPDEAADALRLFLREFPGSPRTLDAQAALALAFEKRGLLGSAAAVLRRLARAPADRDLSLEGRVVKARAFAEERLARDEYRRAAGSVLPAKLTVPLTRRSTYTEKEHPGGASVLRPEGSPPSKGANLVLLNLGAAVKAVDPATGLEAWRHVTESPVRAAYWHEDALLLCADSFVVRLDPATGAAAWRHAPLAPMKGFALAGQVLCYLSPDPRHQASTVEGFDPARGRVSWTQTYPGIALPALVGLDESVAVITMTPGRIHLFDAESGARGRSMPTQSQGGALRVLGCIDGQLVLAGDSNLLECWDLSTANLRWRKPLDRMMLFASAVSRAGVFLAGTRAGEDQAMVVDLRTGKLKALAERLDWGEGTVPVAMDDKVAVVATPMRDRSTVLRALDPNDPMLRQLWTWKGEREAVATVPALAAGHVVALQVFRTPDGKFEHSAAVLESGGRLLQNVVGDAPAERPAALALANDSLLLLVENRVEFWK